MTLLELLNIDFLVAIDEPLASPDKPIVSCLTDLFAWNWDWATGLAKSNTEWEGWGGREQGWQHDHRYHYARCENRKRSVIDGQH